MRRALAAVLLALAASASPLGQTDAPDARKEMDLGARAYRDGNFAEAERRFRRALELDPAQKNAPLFIARAVQQQYKPGVNTPENVEAGERAVAAYQDILAKDPRNEDAYKGVIFLYGQMKRDDKVNELLLQRANDFSLPAERRAEAFAILASKQWQCSYDLTEQKGHKTTEQKPDKIIISYKMPADAGDFIRARQCTTEGLGLAEQAISLDPRSANAWSYKANLLREASKLAEMEGNEAQKADYDRQYDEALDNQKRTAQEALKRAEAGEQGAPAPSVQGPSGPVGPGRPSQPGAPGAKKRVIVGGVLNGKAVSKPLPKYPAEAKAAGAEGVVVVQVTVDEGGSVVSAEAVSGHPLLHEAAVRAARTARFSPTLLSGQPVKVSGVITYNFVLR